MADSELSACRECGIGRYNAGSHPPVEAGRMKRDSANMARRKKQRRIAHSERAGLVPHRLRERRKTRFLSATSVVLDG